ncbi:MAG: hypothetical protein QXS51_04975, partial [Thermoproteota archaeon]
MSVEATGAPLRVSELGLIRRERIILSNINFVLDHSEILGVVSNRIEPVNYLFRILLLLEKPSSGSIVYFNNPLIKRRELIKKIGFYSCQMDLLESSTVLENLLLLASMHGLKKEKAL